jgi:hypothetical protein
MSEMERWVGETEGELGASGAGETLDAGCGIKLLRNCFTDCSFCL